MSKSFQEPINRLTFSSFESHTIVFYEFVLFFSYFSSNVHFRKTSLPFEHIENKMAAFLNIAIQAYFDWIKTIFTAIVLNK